MEGNMKRYLAMVEWQLRNLPKDRRTQIIKDIRYEMELKKLQEGLTEDEVILAMPTPRQMAAQYGGLNTPMYADDIPSVAELERQEQEEKEREERQMEKERRQKEKEEERARRREQRQDEKGWRREFRLDKGNPLIGLLKFAVGIYLFFAILRAVPSIIGGVFGLAIALISLFIVLPIAFSIFGFVLQLVFGILGAVLKAIFRPFA